MLPTAHPLAGREGVALTELAGDPFISFRQGSRLRELLDSAAAAAGFEPRIALESNESRRIRSLVSGGLGVAILPRSDAAGSGAPVATSRLDRAGADARHHARLPPGPAPLARRDRLPRAHAARLRRPAAACDHRRMTDELWVCHLPAIEYREALGLQERVRAARQAERIPDTLLLLEHPPVYTRGRRSDPSELTMGEAWYRERGIDIVDTDRGGRVTYHGPGQLVGYPIMRIGDVIAYLRTMEDAIVAALADSAITAHARPQDGPGLHRRLDRRRAQDRLDRRPRRARRHDARLRDQRRQRPRAVRLGRGLRPQRRADDVGRRADGRRGGPRRSPPCAHGWPSASRRPSRGPPSRSTSTASAPPRPPREPAARRRPRPGRDRPPPRRRGALPALRPRVRPLPGRLEPPRRAVLALRRARAPPRAVAAVRAPPRAARRRPLAAALLPRVVPAPAPRPPSPACATSRRTSTSIPPSPPTCAST